MNETMTEDEARSIRAKGARSALLAAPDVVEFVRARIMSGFTAERGFEVTEASTPLHTGLVDAVDAAYVQIVDWARYWAELLGERSPDVVWPWLRADGELLGFGADIGPRIAGSLTRVQTRWLLDRGEQIERLSASDEYHVDLAAIVWPLKATSGMSKRDRAPASPRPCPVCGEFEVRGEFWGESMTAAEIRGTRWARRSRTVAEVVELGSGFEFDDEFLRELSAVTVRCAHCGETDAFKASEREKLQWLR